MEPTGGDTQATVNNNQIALNHGWEAQQDDEEQ
jgi:hypothetical protein